MNKNKLLTSVIVGGALAGLFVYYALDTARNTTVDEVTYEADQMLLEQPKSFENLESSPNMPAEVDDATMQELDGYVMGTQSVRSEDISDLSE